MEIIYSSIKDIEGLYKVLGDENRLKILFLLMEKGEACVRDIQRVLNVAQPTVSRHLGYLKKMGIVTEGRRGRWNYYSVEKHQPEIVKYQLNALKTAQYRRIFLEELHRLIETLPTSTKPRR